MHLNRLRKNRYPLLLALAIALLAACVFFRFYFQGQASNVLQTSFSASETASILTVDPFSGRTAIGDRDGKLVCTNADGSIAWTLTADNSILDIQFDGEQTVVSADSKVVYFLDSSGNILLQYKTSYRPILLGISPDGESIAIGSTLSFSKNRIDVMNPAGDRLAQWSIITVLKAMYFTADSELLAISNDGSIVLYDTGGTWLGQTQLDYNPVYLAYNRQGGMLIIGDTANDCIALDQTLSELWRQSFSQPVQAVGVSETTGEAMVVLSNGDFFLIGTDGVTVATAKFRDDIVKLAVDDANGRLLALYKGGVDVYNLPVLRSSAFVQKALSWLKWLLSASIAFTAVSVINLFARVRKALWGKAMKTLRSMRKHRKSYLMLLPTLILLAVFCYYPIFSGLLIAFMDYIPGISQKFVGFANFVSMFENSYFWTGVGNMLILLATDLVKALIPSVLFAELIIAMHSKRAQYATRVLLYLPAILPGVASLLIWTTGILGADGLVNGFLRLIGLGQYATTWLGNGRTAIWSLVFIGFPWIGAYIIIYGALISIPDSLYDAAKIDGCGWLKTIVSIDVPMIVPQLKYLFVVSFIASVQDFGRIYLTTGGGPGHATYTPMLELYFNMAKFQKYGEASAMGIFLFMIIFAVTVMNLRMKLKTDV